MESSSTTDPAATWQPNKEILEILIGMGISKIAAEHALYYTGNQSADAAASYVFDNPDYIESHLTDPTASHGFETPNYTGTQSTDTAANRVFPVKINTCPLVKKNKSKPSETKRPENETESSSDDDAEVEQSDSYKMVFVVNLALNMGTGKIASQVAHACLGIYKLLSEFDHMRKIIEDWESDGEKKIVLKGENNEQLRELEILATSNQLFTYLIHDAGRTQVPPNSATVLALFGPSDRVDLVTGKIKLL